MEADMVSQMTSAAKHVEANHARREEHEPPPPPPQGPQNDAAELSSGGPPPGSDPLEGKLGWAMEYIDNARGVDQSLEQGPTSNPSPEQPAEHYDELKTLAWALAADEVTKPDHTPDLEPTI
jgi:hypothetical protein